MSASGSLSPSRQPPEPPPLYILRIKIAPECHRRLDTFDHDQIIVLPLEAGCGKVHGTGAQQLAVDLIALEMHRIARLVLDPDLDARRLGEVIENLRGLALCKLDAVEIDSHLTPRSAARVSACMAWLLHHYGHSGSRKRVSG
jgi:hypothetical protein